MSEKYQPYQPNKWERRVDSLFGLVSTKAALNRMVDRERMNQFRYLAAQPSSARQNSFPSTAGEWLKIQREKMQVMWNAIDMVDNSGLCSGILIKFPTYVCGTLRWQAKTGDKTINTMYQDYIANKTNKPGNIDIKRMHSLRTMCMLDVKSIALKGDVGTNIVREDDELYLQGIEANRIGDPYKWITSDTYVRGLNIDRRTGAIMSARVYHQDRRDGMYKFDDTFQTRDERGLPKFLFFTNPLSFDDYRGVSLFKHAIDNATYIDRMRSYELQALLWAASQSGVYYTKSGALPEQLPFSRTPTQDRDGNVIDTYEARPNTITALSSDGERLEMFQHDRPSPNVIGMYENTVREIAVGAGLTYGFAYDMTGVTGPAVRMCSAQDARAIQIWQEMLREQKLDPIIMLLLGDAIARGDLPYHQNWLKWDWFFPAKPTIDVGRESAANIEEIQAGINTGAKIAADSGDGDIEEIITQRGHEVEMAIEAAQKIAQTKGIEWQEVYALMIPPPKGSGQGGMQASAGMAADRANQNGDQKGATDNGVDLNGEGGNGEGANEFSLKKKDDTCFTIETADSIIEFYNPDQIRDQGGRFGDEGKGAGQPGYKHPGKAGLKGTDKKLVDIVPHRPLTRADPDVKSIVSDYIPGMHYVNYTKTPFFKKLNDLQGTPDPLKISPAEFSAARKALFKQQPKETLKIKDLIATQPVVNSEKVDRNVKEGKTKRIFVVRYGGKDFVMDGHHSMAAAAQRGDKKVKARVLTISNVPHISKFDAESGKTQERDQGGRFGDEGKGSQESGYKHPGQGDKGSYRYPSTETGGAPQRHAPDTHPDVISRTEARGNSRTVSLSEFNQLRDKGKAYVDALKKDSSPITGLDEKWDEIKANAFAEARKPWGGVTLDSHTGMPATPKTGYAISAREPGQQAIRLDENVTQDDFNKAMDQAKAGYPQLLGKGYHLGVFHDDDHKSIDIDPVLIVDKPEDVEAIGAYTHAVGGAYDFSTGDGYFPPHVNLKAESAKTTSNPVRLSIKQSLGTNGIQNVDSDSAESGFHTGDVDFVTFSDGNKGVFKPYSGENHELRPGRVDDNFYQREVAASEVAEVFGMDDLVPATVLRTVDGKEGSMQQFVDKADVAKHFDVNMRYDGDKDLARAAAFDYAIWNTDRHAGNWMIQRNPDGMKLQLIDNGLSFASRDDGGFANHKIYDRAKMQHLDLPDEARHWIDKWPQVEEVLNSHGMSDDEKQGVQKRLRDLSFSSAFSDLPDWADQDLDEGEDMPLSTDETTSSISIPSPPKAISGSKGVLERSGKFGGGGRYPKANEVSGDNPAVHASEWVDPRGGIHERKGPASPWENDYDLFLKNEHGKVAVQHPSSGNWHYEEAKQPLNPDENPKIPGLATGNSSDWKPKA